MKKENSSEKFKVVSGKSKTRNSTKATKIYRTIMLVVLVAFVTFFVTTLCMYSYFVGNSDNILGIKTFLSDDKDTKTVDNKLEQFKKIIDKYYLGTVNEEELEEGAIKGYVEALNDPYTEYISKEEMDSYKSEIQGQYVGVGIVVTQDKQTNNVIVVSTIKDGPAQKAGIQPNDVIKSVDGVECTSKEITEITQKIKGEKGVDVTIEVYRDTQVMSFTITRDIVKTNPVEGEILEGNIGYIAFSSFDQNTAEDFKSKYEELASKGAKSLIIDIRNNGGGIVSEAEKIANYILDKGSTIFYEIDKEGNEKERKTQKDPIINIPTIVMVNENTASSSEILAAALQEHGKARLLGKLTYGKGVIQQLLSLIDGSGIKITSEEYLTPNRTKIDKRGITPDIEVDLPSNIENMLEITREQDTQLDKAIELLK